MHVEEYTDKNYISFGIIGLGAMASVFCDAVSKSPFAKVEAVASRSLEKAQAFVLKKNVAKYYGSYNDMIEDEGLKLDVIYIATPIFCHYELIKLCIGAHKNVLCEKPIVTNAREFEELQRLAEEAHCFLMEGMWMKCLPTYQKAKEWITQGRIGNLKLIKNDFNKKQSPQRFVQRGHGVLLDYGVYSISFDVGFLEEFPNVVEGRRIDFNGLDMDWQIFMSCKDVQVHTNISAQFASTSKAVIVGDKGSIEWEHQFNRTNQVSLYDADGQKLETCVYEYASQGFEYEIEEVYRCMIDGRLESEKVSWRSSFETLRLMDMLL